MPAGGFSAKRFFLWTLVVLFVVLLAAGWTLHSYAHYGEQLSTLAGMTLGDSRGEVKYKLGVPQIVSGGDDPDGTEGAYYTDSQKHPDQAMPAGSDIDHFRTWSYHSSTISQAHIDLTFDAASGRVAQISCIDHSDPATMYCGMLVGVAIGDPEARVTSLLGTPTRESIDERQGVKTMEYADVGAGFLLAKQRVYGIWVVGSGARKAPPLERFLPWFANEVKAALQP